MRWYRIAVCAVTLSVGCVGRQLSRPAAPQPHLVPVDTAACRAVLRDDAPMSSLQQAIGRSVGALESLPPEQPFTALDRQASAAQLRAMLSDVNATLSAGGDLPAQVCDRLRLYRVEVPNGVLVTGYYAPELAANRTRTERFRYPIYRTPDDLVDIDLGRFCPACGGAVTQGRMQDGTLVPYYSRAEIEAGELAGHGYELAWLDDPVEAFFLHVQGSARLRFEDGVHMDISYSSSNGRPYTSIGRILVEQGKMKAENLSLGALKDYLRAHPEEQASLLAANERYIFFRSVAIGPVGSLGVPLTAGRSIAADRNVYPPGALAFLRVEAHPAVSRFVTIQDAGAAIAGPRRLDIFWGAGPTAEHLAGEMHAPGEFYLVLPKPSEE